MGRGAYQLLAPVVAPHGSIAPRGELQVAVGAEVDEGIGPELTLHIQIRCEIGVRRCHIDAVDEAEVIVAQGWTRLQEEQHVAIAHGRHGDAVGWRAVASCHLSILSSRNHLPGPLLVDVACRPQRMVGRLMDVVGKGIDRRGESVQTVALLTKSEQEVIHRRDDLHAAGQQGVLPRTAEIAYGDVFITVGLGTQRQVAADVVGQCLTAFHFCRIAVVALGIGVLCADAVRRHAAVYLRNDDTGILRAA